MQVSDEENAISHPSQHVVNRTNSFQEQTAQIIVDNVPETWKELRTDPISTVTRVLGFSFSRITTSYKAPIK